MLSLIWTCATNAKSVMHFNQRSLCRTENGLWLSHTQLQCFVHDLFYLPNLKSPILFGDQFAKFNVTKFSSLYGSSLVGMCRIH